VVAEGDGERDPPPQPQRLTVLNDKEGVWRCRTTFNCTDACPRGIKVSQAIQEVKRALLFRKV
jgi:succinate dehydrogenase / fumarate reductase iron-sulfur subunit